MTTSKRHDYILKWFVGLIQMSVGSERPSASILSLLFPFLSWGSFIHVVRVLLFEATTKTTTTSFSFAFSLET